MIKHMFVFGVLLPTLITITVFVGFLICWFKFNIKERVMKSQFFIKHFTKQIPNVGGGAAMHDSVVFSRNSYPGQGKLWDDHDPRSDAGQAMLMGRSGTVATDARGRLYGFDWTTNVGGGGGGDDDASSCAADEPQYRFSVPNPEQCPGDGAGLRAAADGRGRTSSPRAGRRAAAAEQTVDEWVPQTYRFPAIKRPDGEGHVMGIQMTGACPEDTDYGHFIPLSKDEREACWRRTDVSCYAAAAAAADKDCRCQSTLVSTDCPTGPALALDQPPVIKSTPTADQLLADAQLVPLVKSPFRSDASPSVIAAI